MIETKIAEDTTVAVTKPEIGIMETPKRRFMDKKRIFAAKDKKFEDVHIPEWDEDGEEAWVRIRALTATERDAFESSLVTGSGKNQVVNTENVRAKVAALTVVDETNSPLFTENDIVALGMKSAAALDRIYDVAMRLSKMSKEDMEETAKNSGKGRSAAS